MKSTALKHLPDVVHYGAALPGNVLTEGVRDLGHDYIDATTASIPLKRLGTVESEEAGFITGQTLVIDGGQTLPESLQALAG